MKNWKELRQTLTADMTDMEQIKTVTSYWSKAPIMARALNWDSPGDWPDPWKLIFDGEFDDSSIALGMFYTLLLSEDGRWNTDRLSLMLVLDRERQVQKLVLKVDCRWLLNLDYNSVVDGLPSPKTFFVQQKYGYDGKRHFCDVGSTEQRQLAKENL